MTPDDYLDEMDDDMGQAGHRDGAGSADERDELDVALAGGPLADALSRLRGLADLPAPEPSAQLAALFAGTDALAARRRSRRRAIVVGAVVAGSMSLGLTGVAAANDRLPGGSQNVVARVINNLTPFHVDERDPVRPPVPATTPRTTGPQTTVPPAPTQPEPERSRAATQQVGPAPARPSVVPSEEGTHPGEDGAEPTEPGSTPSPDEPTRRESEPVDPPETHDRKSPLPSPSDAETESDPAGD